MEPDYKSLLQKMVDQIDIDYAVGDEISQELWELKVAAKVALQI